MESGFLPLVVLLLCARLSTSQEVVRSFSGTSEELLGVQVSSSGELLVRSSERVYVINTNGGVTVVSTLNGSSAVFQQSDILSSSAALRCAGNQCGLHPLTNLGQALWNSVVLPQMVTGLPHNIITQFSNTTISLNTEEVVDRRYLDAGRYDFEFVSTNFSSPPTSVKYSRTDTAQMCTGCTGKFLEIFSAQSELMETNPYSFYLGTVSGSSNSTILMHTCNGQTEVTQSRRPGGGGFINWLRASLRRITCGGSALADKAHFSEDASNGGDSLLFTAFSGSICMHKYSDLRKVFEMANPNCGIDDRQPSGEVVASPQLMQVSGSNIAAMGGSVVRGFHFFMVALQNGTVLQYHINDDTAIFVDQQQLPADSEVAMEIDASRDGLDYYVTTPQKIYRLSLDNCGTHSSCVSCVQSANPLCGWCSTEGRCMSTDSCSTAGTFTGHNNASNCPAITNVSPEQAYIVNNETITLTTKFVPLGGNSYECRYKFDEMTFSRSATNNGSVFMCESPSEEQLRPIVQANRGAAVPELQLFGQFGGNPILLATTEQLTYFDCRSYVKCGDCVQQVTCQWCSRDLECKPREANSCSDGNVVYTDATHNRCPQIVPTPGPNLYSYPFHINMTSHIDVHVTFADNTIPSSRGALYTCIYQEQEEQGSTTRVEGTVMSSSEVNGLDKIVIRCASREFQPTMSPVPRNLTLRLEYQTSSGRAYELDNPMDLGVFLYNCTSVALARDCSECVSLPPELSCGYCSSPAQCLHSTFCTAPNTLIGSQQDTGQCPVQFEFTPTGGPVEGGTTVTITGTNLPLELGSIDSVMVEGVQCQPSSSGFQPATQLSCTTSAADGPVTGPVQLTFRDATGTPRTARSVQSFSFRDLAITVVSPITGIAAGGTVLTLTGLSLLVGSTHRVTVGGQECAVVRSHREEASLQCSTPPGGVDTSADIVATVDNWPSTQPPTTSGPRYSFSYRANPQVESVTPLYSFQSGGIPLNVNGSDFSNVQSAQIMFTLVSSPSNRQRRQTAQFFSSTCIIQQPPMNTAITCPSPATPTGTTTDTMTISFQLDGLTVTSDDVNQTVAVHQNPTFAAVAGGTITQQLGKLHDITIEATGIQPDLVRPYLRVFIGSQPLCSIESISESQVVCRPVNITQDPYASPNSVHNITVHLGNQQTIVGLITFQTPVPFEYLLYVGLPVLGGVLLCAVLLTVVGCCVCQRRVRKKTRLLDELQGELHQIEASVVNTVKTGFAELHAEVEETAGDQMNQHLPFRDLPGFVYLNFFQEEKPSIVLEPLGSVPGRSNDVPEVLSDFRRLLLDKKFLMTVIRTLEHQQTFDINSRCQFAALLMVLLATRLDYATEVLKQLLSDQIRQLASRGESHLFVRKTQSVGDKMLSCWLALCLREHVEDTTGPALYMLLRATKSQLDKGPVDVVTGEARYSLSERTILRSLIDNYQEVSAVVETDDGGRFPIKLLDCDTITQAKEKIMDVAFRSVKHSQRHNLSEIDIEYRFESNTLILRDEDKSSVTEGPWRRINTLRHYRVSLTGAVFRLVPRKDKPSNGHAFDHPCTMVASYDARFRRRMSSITSDGLHLWHLTKQMDATSNGASPFAGRKLMTEIFFPQMMYTKNVLQKFVNDFVDSVFNVSLHNSPQGSSGVYANLGTVSVPPAIKYLFDFLDQEAINHNVHHPNILHVWKCNRFWVNLVKNPEFVFDVSKSHTVDACLSVVAQAIMDSCSLTEEKLTRDAPAGRLLFHKDVRSYKQTIRRYYEDVRRLPPVMPQQMKAHLARLSQTYNHELLMSRQGVNMDRVLYSLFGCVSKYSDEVVEALEAAGLLHQMQALTSIKSVLA